MAIAEKSRVKGGNSLKDQWISALLLYSPRPARQRKGQDRAQNSAELLHALTGGSALAPMAVRSFGSGAQEARLAGADLDSQLLYGIGSAALSVETERISNIAKPLQKMFGQGAAGRIALSAIGEGGEEVVEDLFQPFLKRATYDQSARFDAGEAGHDFLVGAILGGLGGGVETIGNLGSGPAYNQAGTAIAAVQAPAAPETARGGEAVQSRPLDVMEQEVQRLYGRRDSAAPQAGGGALTQALFGNGKDGPGAAEPDTLPITAERDMLEIKKEGIAHGAEDRGRAESAGRFVERSRKALCGVRESGDVVFGFRRSVESGISGSARAFQEELTALGVPCELMDGEVEWNRDGVTRTRWIEEAAAFAGKLVFINGETTIAPRNAAGHEAYHFWKNSEAREAFDEVLQDNLLFSSKDFLDYQNTITRKYFGGEVDLSSQKNLDKLMEELFAYIAGDIHEGTNEAYLRPMLHDYDAVKAAWEALIRFAPEANPTGDADPLMQEIRHLYGRRETAAPEVKTDALTQILLDSIKPAEALPAPDAAGQELLRLYKEAQALPPQPGGDALIQVLSGGGTAAPETAAEPDAFLLGFQDDGGGPGGLGPAAADLAEFAELQAILGVDAPKSIAEFLDLKYNDQDGWERLETQKEQTVFVESAPCVTTPKKYTGYFLKPETKHSQDFFGVGYTQDNPLQLRYDMARQFDMEKAVDIKELGGGARKFSIYMELGVTKRRFCTGWIQDTPDSLPRIVTAFRKNR